MLSNSDIEHARSVWEEWTLGKPYDLDVLIVGEHSSGVDQDRPVGVLLSANLSLRLIVRAHVVQTGNGVELGGVIFDQPCHYSREALLASVSALSRLIAERG